MARKKLDTLTEQMYYVLLALTEERHGYGIMQYATELTGGRVSIGAGTLYALLARFEEEGLIQYRGEKENRKYYKLTDDGRRVLDEEYGRLRRQVADGSRILGKEGAL
ncbi:MAG: PadR family transcriptional regulator [Clostridia bacterium]|nr:PadR family transcriptional regulator [Clostridia bacterium]